MSGEIQKEETEVARKENTNLVKLRLCNPVNSAAVSFTFRMSRKFKDFWISRFSDPWILNFYTYGFLDDIDFDI